MGLSVRHYLFPEDAPPERVAQRLAEGLVDGSASMPQFAGTRQRALMVVLENEDGVPQRAIRYEGMIWTFDDEGSIREGLQESFAEFMNATHSIRDRDGTVVPIGPEISKRKLAAKYRWSPTKEHLDAIAADIWPQGKSALKQASGTPPKPRLTFQAKQVLQEASEPFWKVGYSLDRLTEKDLPGFIYEARERAEDDPDYAALYGAVAEMAERRLAIKRRRRSSKGVWYAAVDVTRWKDHTGEVVATFHERCDGKAAAIAAARGLLVLHADKVSDDVTVEVRLETDLEWERSSRLLPD